jgi:hypothetical protein
MRYVLGAGLLLKEMPCTSFNLSLSGADKGRIPAFSEIVAQSGTHPTIAKGAGVGPGALAIKKLF